uniref:Reverse transcriptase Ty1/copia-type domain-containing protein n=1 Tax=Chromera velia CCMP2878 TaxID=1169474 RepID=A0A0K6SA12_9ALVE|eukprot:Cvel_32449.t1-p1 / transcript=Cvel_32449.t1 / gene=Cvel_32449 / organism=Chromera_velia_CCMP2878 / gene_product=hypothetical protein / transcript_product=hypothetical protein / location=Cvel_scaffold5054:527-1360(+) / protein_length=278 / sequence_SO=supercontig / SO=protein_coding / is_pseudo=false
MGENLDIKKKGEQEKGKARMFVKGGRDMRPIDTYAGVPSLVGLNVSFVYILGLDPPMQIYGVDVEKAFQQVDNKNRDTHGAIGVRIPVGFPVLPTENPFLDRFTDKRWVELTQEAAELQPGSIHLLAKAHYGGRGSGNLFCGLFQREMQSLGGYEVVDESVLVKRKGAGRDGLKGGKPAARSAADALVVHFVDDVQGSGAGVKRELELLGQRIKLGPIDTLQPGGEDRFVGLDMEMEEGRLFVSQKNYLKTVEADWILHIAGGARRQVTDKCMQPPEE